MKKFTSTSLPIIQNSLLGWFDAHQRDLPWRRTYDPYQVWISEIMLQQTQVKTALPYFDRWMETLPTIGDVAEATEESILKLWEGLGYYSRARNLKKAAQEIMEKHGGKFPDRYESIRSLPGIGPYTAGAIASIAFNQDRPIVDGNIIRLIARLLDYRNNTRTNIKPFWDWAEQLIPSGKARNFNQAMMEFGALVCTPQSPRCGDCPLKEECGAYKAGRVEEIPNRGPRQEKVQIQVAIAVIHDPKKPNKFFIQKRKHGGLMGGLWEFPGGKCETSESPKAAVQREVKEELGITLQNIKPLKRISHAYTKFSVDLHCFTAERSKGIFASKGALETRWVDIEEMEKLPFPAANVKLIKTLKNLIQHA